MHLARTLLIVYRKKNFIKNNRKTSFILHY